MYNEDEIEVKTTVGEIVDVIGMAAAEICPEDFTDEETHAFTRPFAQVGRRVAKHFSGEEPFDEMTLMYTAIIRNLLMARTEEKQ